MTIVRVGSTGKYADGWGKAFAKSRTSASDSRKKSAKNVAPKRPSRKKTSKKR